MATQRLQVYKCEVCGNMVESIHPGGGQLVCCGQPMTLQKANTVDAAQEKHVPVVEKIDGGFLVKVGDVAHPMGEDHYIEWIELLVGDTSYRAFLSPGDTPQATFLIDETDVTARAYCNLHGLWKS